MERENPAARRQPAGHSDLLFQPLIAEACARLGARADCWRIVSAPDQSAFWITARHQPSRCPEQGWKLHISASVRTAGALLSRTLPILFAEDADFKVVASLRRLAELNEGRVGFSQVGKFITIYPNDDAQAVHLASALDAATRGLRGPTISSDRPLAARGVVHYRYGGFGAQHLRTPLGETLPSIRTPDGTLVPDRRLDRYSPPPWAHDPFLAAGVAADLPAPGPRIGQRYVILAILHRSPRSTIYLCLDVDVPRRCVIKRVGEDGNEGPDRLRHEAAVLARLTPDQRFPAPFDLFAHDGDLFLAMEDVEGETIEQYIAAKRARNMLPTGEEIVRWGRELAAMLDVIHAKGFVYGDLKASNVVVSPDGRLRMLDFELAQQHEGGRQDHFRLHVRGTQGYMSPRLVDGHAPEVADDVYGLGALLYLAATGAEPSQAPNSRALLERPLEVLNPAIAPPLARVISRCLDPDPASRFATPAEAALGLSEVGSAKSARHPHFGRERPLERESTARQQSRALARRTGDTLCTLVKLTPDGRVRAWTGEHPGGDGFPSTDLNAGGAGAIVALAELVAEFDDPMHRAVLADGAYWLAEAPRPAGMPLAGLYVGEAGVGVAELRAGQVLGDSALIATSAERGHWIATLPHSSPDLFNGTAGRLRFHLWLWNETTDAEHLRHAIAAGEQLLATAESAACGGVRWTIPPGYGSLSNRALLGYAHGAAGIGDALLDLFEATADGRFLTAAQGAGAWLECMAKPALEDESGLNWPADENDQRPSMAFWCHGAAGISRFLLHLGALDALTSAMQLAERAARVVARGTRWAGATQCHGLAGNVECLLDLYQATGNSAYLVEARSLAHLLKAFAHEVDGVLSWVTDAETANPGFTVGCAGVATCLLRLAYPETRPPLFVGTGSRRAIGAEHPNHR